MAATRCVCIYIVVMALCGSTTHGQATPSETVVAGVRGNQLTLNGSRATVSAGQRLPMGTRVKAGTDTTVFLHQEWDTPRGRCVYWRVLRGAEWETESLKRYGEECPPINNRLSLRTAAATQGIKDLSDLHRPVTSVSAPPTDATGRVAIDSSGVEAEQLRTRLSRELRALLGRP